MISVDILSKYPKKPPRLTFPDRCVNCGKPGEKTIPVRLNTGAQTNVSIVAGVIVGSLVESGVKILLTKMIFENDDTAREFIALNPQENE